MSRRRRRRWAGCSAELSRISERLLIDGATPTEALTMLKFWVSTRRPILEWSTAASRRAQPWAVEPDAHEAEPRARGDARRAAVARPHRRAPLAAAADSLQVREGWRHSAAHRQGGGRSISLLLAAVCARSPLKAWWQRRLAKALDSYAAQLEANHARHRAALWPKAQERFWDSVLSFYAV